MVLLLVVILYNILQHTLNHTAMTELTATTALKAPDSLQAAIEAFINDQDVKANSKKVYDSELRQFFAWVKVKGYPIDGLTRPHVIEYKTDLLQAGKATTTVSGRLSAVRLFYEWAEGCKLYPNIARGVRAPRRQDEIKKHPLTADQAKQLCNYFEAQASGTSNPEAIQPLNLTAKRDYALVNLIMRTGMRTIEASRLNIEDITYNGGHRVIGIRGKGYDGVSRVIRLSDKAYKPLQEYLKYRGATTGPVFVSTSNNSTGQRLNTRTISGICKQGMQAVGIDDRKFTAHSLRHSFAVLAILEGATVEQVQFDMGHTSPATTQLYTKYIHQQQRLENGAAMMLDNAF